MKKILFIILNILFINSLLANDLNNKQDIFTTYCWGCHHQTSMAFGPSFEQIANTRDIGQIQAHILNPKLTYKAFGYKRSVMPSFENQLSLKQVEEISKYIISFKKENK